MKNLVLGILLIAAGNLFPQQFSLSTDYYNLYRERSEFSDMDLLYRNTDFISMFDISDTKLTFNLGYTKAYFNWNHRPENIQSNFETEQKFSSVSIHTGFKNIFIDSRLTLNSIGSKTTFDYSVLFGLKEINLSFRKISYPFNWNLSYRSDGFNVNTGSTFYTAGTSITGTGGNNSFKVSYEQSIAGTDNSKGLYSVISKPDYYNIILEMKNSSSFPFQFSIGNTSINLRSDLLINSIQFSTLKLTSYSDFKITGSISPRIKNIPLNISVQLNLYEGSLSGDAESWPFTDIIQSLVVNRLNFKLNGKANLYQLSSSADLTSGNFTFQPEITAYYVQPDLTIKSWQPVYLAFGIKNYSETSDGINYAWLGNIGLTAGYNFGIAELVVKLNQFIPFYIGKETAGSGSFSEGPPVISTPSGPGKKSSGGTFISAAIRKTF